MADILLRFGRDIPARCTLTIDRGKAVCVSADFEPVCFPVEVLAVGEAAVLKPVHGTCSDCEYSRESGSELLCWGQKEAPPVSPEWRCDGWKGRLNGNEGRLNGDKTEVL
jgi:hypothetical protein